MNQIIYLNLLSRYNDNYRGPLMGDVDGLPAHNALLTYAGADPEEAVIPVVERAVMPAGWEFDTIQARSGTLL
jgi:hypothetical protein